MCYIIYGYGPFFLYSSVLIVELINYLQNQSFLVKIVQKIISCE